MRPSVPNDPGPWLLALAGPSARAADVFVVKPYLQLGDAPTSNTGDLALLWAADDVDADWSVEYRAGSDADWKKAEGRSIRRVVSQVVPPQRVYRASLVGLAPGVEFTYQVRKGGEVRLQRLGEVPQVGRPAVSLRGRGGHRPGQGGLRRRSPSGWSWRSPTS